ncbi:MAG: AraC family transcriptional regulator, partial [Alphaproteobacteria bacterium]
MNFLYKIQSISKGGIARIMGAIHEQSLLNLDHTLDYEIKTFSTIENGIVVKKGSKYLKQTITTTFANLPKNLRILHARMAYFFKKNKIASNGKPFVIYHTYDTAKKLTKISVCIPVKEEIRTTPESDITFGMFPDMRSVKVTLNGDYSHRDDAWKKASDFVIANKLERDPNIRVIELLTKGIEDVNKPSKWVTSIYFPLRSAAIAPATPEVKIIKPSTPAR